MSEKSKNSIPGYSGYKPQTEVQPAFNELPKDKHIPGYKGFVKGIKAENLFAQTYGRTTHASIDDRIERGFDMPNKDKYVSVN